MPVTVAGNFLVFRKHEPVDAAAQATWAQWLRTRDIVVGERKTDLMPLPSGGVFAEAVLGRFNSAEKLDITRFWNWQDSPIPITPPEIAAIQTGSRAQAENLLPGQLPQATLKVELPPDLPDPQGLAAILQAIQNGNMFRDMSGLNSTIGFAQSALSRAFDAARDAAAQAGENMKTAADIYKSAFGGQGSTMPGGATRQLPTGTTRNPSETGALINQGKDMDDRGLKPGSNGSTAATGNETAAFNSVISPDSAGGGRIQYVSADAGTNLPPIASTALGKALVGDPNGQLDLAEAVVDHLNSLARPNSGSCVACSAAYFVDAMKKIGVPFEVIQTIDAADAGAGAPVEMSVIASENGIRLAPRTLVTIWFSNAFADNWMRIPSWCRGAGAPGALFYANLIENQALIKSATGWPQGMKPGAHMQLWRDEAEFNELRDNGTVPSLGHSCVFQGYVSGSPDRLTVSDQMGVAREVRYPLFGLKFVIAGNLSKAKLVTFT